MVPRETAALATDHQFAVAMGVGYPFAFQMTVGLHFCPPAKVPGVFQIGIH
jgi:hypothetical protein